MATDDDDRVGGGIPEQVRRDLHQVWTLVDSQKPDVETAAKRRFAAATVAYYRALRPHRDEQVIREHDWTNQDIHWLRDLLDERVVIREDSGGWSSGVTRREVPAIDQVPIGKIEDVADDLDDLAKALGFTENARDQTPKSEVTHEDLRGLVELRGQDAALENLPPAAKQEADD